MLSDDIGTDVDFLLAVSKLHSAAKALTKAPNDATAEYLDAAIEVLEEAVDAFDAALEENCKELH